MAQTRKNRSVNAGSHRRPSGRKRGGAYRYERNLSLAQEDVLALGLLAALAFYVMMRVMVVVRVGIQGSAYFFAAYQLMLFFLMLYPLPLSEALYDQVPLRFAQGRYRNGKYLFNAAVVQAVVYLILVALLWIMLGDWIATRFLLGRYEVFTLLLLLVTLVFSTLTLTIRGYLDAIHDGVPQGLALLLREAGCFFLVLIFSGMFQKSGETVSALLLSSEACYAYGAAGVAFGLLLASMGGFLVYLLVYRGSTRQIREQIAGDRYKYRENSGNILLRESLPTLCGLAALPLAELLWMRSFLRCDAIAAMLSYQWGCYSGIAHTALLFPLLFSVLVFMDSFGQIRKGLEQRNGRELSFKLQGLMKLCLTATLAWSAHILFSAGAIVHGLFGQESQLAVRLLRWMALLLPLCVCAVLTTLLIYAARQTLWLLAHTAISCIVAMALGRLIGAGFLVPIHRVLLTEILFFALLLSCNVVFLTVREKLRILDVRDLPGLGLCLAASAIGSLIWNVVFGLFLPDLLVALGGLAVVLLIGFIMGGLTGSISSHVLLNLPLGARLRALGRRLRVMR